MGLLKKLIGVDELDDQNEITDEEIQEEKNELKQEKEERRFSLNREEKVEPKIQTQTTFQNTQTSAMKLVLVEPKDSSDSLKLADHLKNRKPVIVNLESVETEAAKKIFNFLQGVAYALNGNTQRIANNIYIFTPYNVDVNTADLANTISESGFGNKEDSSWRG